MRSASALHQQSEDFQKFFTENKELFDSRTLNQVQNLLQNGRRALQEVDPSIGMNGAQRADYIARLSQRQSRLAPQVQQIRDIGEARSAGDTKSVSAYEGYNDATQRLEVLRAQNKELKRRDKLRSFAEEIPQSDIDTRGQYRTTANGKKQQYAIDGAMAESGFNDLMYDYINKNPYAIHARRANASYGDARMGTDDEDLLRMSDDEMSWAKWKASQT